MRLFTIMSPLRGKPHAVRNIAIALFAVLSVATIYTAYASSTPSLTATNPTVTAALSPFSRADDTIGNMRLNESTVEQFLSVYGHDVMDDTTYESVPDLGGAKQRMIKYDNMQAIFVQSDGEPFVLYGLMVDGDSDIIGPRGIHIGMTTTEFNALFPDYRQGTGRPEEGIAIVYSSGTSYDPDESYYGHALPMGFIQFRDEACDYTYVCGTKRDRLGLIVSIENGKIKNFGLVYNLYM